MKLTVNGKEAVFTDYNTCEQYVLAELEAAQIENEELRKRIEELEREKNEADAKKAESPDGEIEPRQVQIVKLNEPFETAYLTVKDAYDFKHSENGLGLTAEEAREKAASEEGLREVASIRVGWSRNEAMSVETRIWPCQLRTGTQTFVMDVWDNGRNLSEARVAKDAEKACTEVEDYYAAVSFLAQTALREAVGRSTVAEVALRRDQLDAEIKDDIEKEAAGWGVDIISVKVRDIVIPDELQEVMSLEAQADREKNARMTVAGVEAELAEMLAEAARVYGDPEAALKLRTMLMQYDTVKKSKGTAVTVPTAMSDGFTDSAMMNGDRTTER